MPSIAQRVQHLGPSVFAEINGLARQHQAINIGQGAPDFDGPPEVIAAAVAALQSGSTTQYAPALGTPALREAIAHHANVFYGQEIDPFSETLVFGGASLGIYFVIMGLVNPGDEVIVFEPFFDTYVPNIDMAGAVPRFVSLRQPDWSFDADELRAAFNHKTKAILINTPHNPTGKVFSRQELELIADLCHEWDVIAITDEVYEHLLYDDAEHIRLATLPGMFERTITVSSAGKTFSTTGFKIGWCMGPANLIQGPRLMHEFSMFAVTHPLQEAVAVALRYPESYFAGLQALYTPKRDFLAETLQQAGFRLVLPNALGAFYLMADFSAIYDGDDRAFTRHLITEYGVACIPASPFYTAENAAEGSKLVRMTFCKQDATLQAAAERLAMLGH